MTSSQVKRQFKKSTCLVVPIVHELNRRYKSDCLFNANLVKK